MRLIFPIIQCVYRLRYRCTDCIRGRVPTRIAVDFHKESFPIKKTDYGEVSSIRIGIVRDRNNFSFLKEVSQFYTPFAKLPICIKISGSFRLHDRFPHLLSGCGKKQDDVRFLRLLYKPTACRLNMVRQSAGQGKSFVKGYRFSCLFCKIIGENAGTFSIHGI